jgi:hypothetical protein
MKHAYPKSVGVFVNAITAMPLWFRAVGVLASITALTTNTLSVCQHGFHAYHAGYYVINSALYLFYAASVRNVR